MLSNVNVLIGSEQKQFILVKQVFWVLQRTVTPVGLCECEIWPLSKRVLEMRNQGEYLLWQREHIRSWWSFL